MRTTLYKEQNSNTRYYKVELYKTIFGEFVVEGVYGNIRYKSPTGKKRMYFYTLKEAKEFFLNKIKSKIKRGYKG